MQHSSVEINANVDSLASDEEMGDMDETLTDWINGGNKWRGRARFRGGSSPSGLFEDKTPRFPADVARILKELSSILSVIDYDQQ